MAEQSMDRLTPNDIVVKVRQSGNREPNCPGNADNKMKRLRKLLWSGDWSDQDISLIAWSETQGCWYMWRAEERGS